MKFSAYTLSLPTLTPIEGARLVSSCGLAGVEWRVAADPAEFRNESPSFTRNNLCTIAMTVDGGRQGGEHASRYRLDVVGLAPYIDVGDVAAFVRAAQTAKACGTRNIRVRAPELDGRSFDDLFRFGRRFLEDAVQVAKDFEVKAVLEMHQRTLCPSASLAERMVNGLDPRYLGVIYDVGNMVLEGYEDPRIGLGLLGEYLCHVHLKNAAWYRAESGAWGWRWAPLDSGMVDVPAFLRCLSDHEYQGWVSLEDLSSELPPDETLRYNVGLLRDWGYLA